MNKVVLLVRNVAPEKFGGGEMYQILLAEELKKNGFCPVILTNSCELLRRAEENEIEALRPPYIENQNWSGWRNILLPKYILWQKRLKKWYRNTYKKYKPCVVNLQSRDDLIAGTLVAKSVGAKVLWTDHADFKNWVLWNVNVPLKNMIGRKIIKLSRLAEKVIFVSEGVERETKRMVAPKKMHNTVVIQNGVQDRKEEYRNIVPKKDSFVFIGRVVKEKGVDELLKAFDEVKRNYPNTILNIYGEGELMEERGNVNMCGSTNDQFKALAENEVFVLPSYQEGLSLSLLEAAMMGKKIIATNVDGNLEVIKNEETGILVPPKNVEKLADAMEWIMEHKKASDEMAKKVRRKYEEEFDFGKIFAKKMLPLYNREKETEK